MYAQLLGVSVDSVFSHAAWCSLSRELGGLGGILFPLLSDLNNNISKAFGVLNTAGGYSQRACFLIEGSTKKIKHITINDADIGRNTEETLRIIDMIKHLQENKSSVCPACWKRGDKALSATAEAVKEYIHKHMP